MYRSVCWLSLDLNKRSGKSSVSLGQGETGKTIKFRLYENGEPYKFEDGCYVVLSGVMAEELTIYNDCYIDNGVVVYDITENKALYTPGVIECQLIIHSVDGGAICSPKFQIVVHEANYSKEVVEQTDQFFGVQKLLEDMNNMANLPGGGGGLAVVTLNGMTPSMSCQEIYNAYQGGVVVRLDVVDDDGNHHLLDMDQPPSETNAVFKKAEDSVDGILFHAASLYTVNGVSYGMYTKNVRESESNGSLPLAGKTILLFGDDYATYTDFVAEVERLTGATVKNLAVHGTMPGVGHPDELKNAFALANMMSAATCFQGNYSVQENAIENAKQNGVNTAREETVLDMLKGLDATVDYIILSYGKAAYYANAALHNTSSTSDTSTFYGGLASAMGIMGLKFYRNPIVANTHATWISMTNGTQWSDDWPSNEENAAMGDYNLITRQFADDHNFEYIELYKNTGFSQSCMYQYASDPNPLVPGQNYAWATTKGQIELARVFVKQLV